jgi:hypothetical protein
MKVVDMVEDGGLAAVKAASADDALVMPTDDEKLTDRRFFGKPIEEKQIIALQRDMVGEGALKIVPKMTIALAVEALARTSPGRTTSAADLLTSENEPSPFYSSRP